jgi:hypothetical protein
MAIQSSTSQPGQFAAAIAAASPRAKAAGVIHQATQQISEALVPPEQTAETLARLKGELPDGVQTAHRPG